MKTPDFDDLLAAFDIPDIDAKEAIQSAPEDSDGQNSGTAGGVGKAGGSGGGPLRPPSPTEPHQTPHATTLSQSGELPGVSVIVKNRVRPDAFGEGEGDTGRDSNTEAGAQGGVGSALAGPRLGLRLQGLGCTEPLIHNGFEGCAAEASDLPLSPTQTQSHSNGQLWSPASPKAAAEGASSTSTAVFGRAKPLVAQGPNDSMTKARKPSVTPPQQEHQPQEEEARAGDVTDRSASIPGSGDVPSSHVSAASVGSVSTFFSTSTTPPPPSSSLFVGPLLPSLTPLQNVQERCRLNTSAFQINVPEQSKRHKIEAHTHTHTHTHTHRRFHRNITGVSHR